MHYLCGEAIYQRLGGNPWFPAAGVARGDEREFFLGRDHQSSIRKDEKLNCCLFLSLRTQDVRLSVCEGGFK